MAMYTQFCRSFLRQHLIKICQRELIMLYPQLYTQIRHLTYIQGIPGPLTLQGVCSMLVVDVVPEPLYKTLLTYTLA